MGEAWDDLGVLRTQRDQCARDVSQLMDACARDHPENKHVIECRECFEKVIDRMRSRYLEPRDDAPREWFSGRAGLLKELDELFLAVREYKRDLDKVDTRLDTERKQWYEQQLRASPSIRKTIEELLDRKKVFADIGTKGLGFEETVAEVREALESPGLPKSEVREEEAGKTLDRLVAASTPEAKLQVYKEAFFQGDPEEQVSEKVRSYMDRLQNGATMDQIINTISMDRRSSIGAQSQKEQHRQRVEELRRAKNAHELQKQKKASGRKDSNQKPQPPDEMYDQPPCHACGRELDLQDYMACALCQVLVDNGVRTKPTLFCSSACFSGQDGQEAHVEKAHDCAGSDNCAQLVDEDTDMDMDGSGHFLCKECTSDFRKEAVYCSARCAELNFQRHREQVHLPERKQRELDVGRDLDALEFEGDDKTKYHARNIRLHLAPIGDLLHEFQQKNFIEAAENIYP